MAETAALLADEVLPEHPLRQWVLSLPHALRFLLASDPDALTLVLGVVYRAIARHLINQAGLARATGATGAVTLVQRFGSALNLNIHFHMLFLDGVYLTEGANSPTFRHVAAPGANELQALVEQIAAGVGQVLERRGLIERDIENSWLAAGAEPGPLDDLIGHSITYRIAVGPRAGQKLFTLQTVPPRLQGLEGDPNGAARAATPEATVPRRAATPDSPTALPRRARRCTDPISDSPMVGRFSPPRARRRSAGDARNPLRFKKCEIPIDG